MKHSVNVSLVPSRDELKPIRLRVSWAATRVDLRVGYSIEAGKWNAAESRVLPNHKNKFKVSGNEINKAINKALLIIDEIFNHYDLLGSTPTAKELKAEYNKRMGIRTRGTTTDFFTCYDAFVSEMSKRNEWSDETLKRFRNLRNHFFRFNPKLTLRDVNDTTLQNFVNYFHDRKQRNTTINKTLSFVRWFLNWAAIHNYYRGNSHITFRPRLKGTDDGQRVIIYLEWEELLQFFSFEYNKAQSSLAATRDVFCFQCFTGLRYSDVAKLKKTEITEKYISVVTKKTVDPLHIELNQFSKAILEKYKNIPLPKNKALPVISNAKFNEYLKQAAKTAGINAPVRKVYFIGNQRIEEVKEKWQVLTTHCGRKTFIVNSLYLRIPTTVIMKWTGHKNIKAMAPYIKIVDKLKEEEMAKFDALELPNKPE